MMAGFAAALVLACTGCAQGEAGPFPATWTEIMEGKSWIELRPDGTGTFEAVPFGAGESECDLDDASPYSGDVEWEPGPGDALLVSSAGGVLYIYPDTQGFGGRKNWQELSVAICGPETPSDQTLNYGKWD
jgi:hypothetical protein